MNGYNLIPSCSSVGLSDSSSLIIYDVRIDGFFSKKIKKPSDSKYQFRVYVFDSTFRSEPSHIEIRKDNFIFYLKVEPRIFDKLVTLHMMKSSLNNITILESSLKDNFIKRQILDFRFFSFKFLSPLLLIHLFSPLSSPLYRVHSNNLIRLVL